MSKTTDTVKGRQLREEGYLEMVGVTSQEHPEVSTCTGNGERDEFNAQSIDNAKDLLDKICTRENTRAACKRVVQNKGASGIDKMSVRELNGWLAENYEATFSDYSFGFRSNRSGFLPVEHVWNMRRSLPDTWVRERLLRTMR